MRRTQLLVLAIFGLVSQIAVGQKLSGKFAELRTEGTQSLTFSNGTFKHSGSVEGQEYFGQGKYTVHKGILTLKYQRIMTGRDSSNYSLVYRAGALSKTIVSFKMVDESNAVLKGTLTLRDREGDPIAIFESAKDGTGTIWLAHHSSIGYISLENRDSNSIIIDVSRMRGAHYDLIATMVQTTTYYIEPKIVKYKILKRTNEQLFLKSDDDGSLSLFKEK
ncbi:hypothetical protein ACVWYN_000489 [Pedobacter sp. UYP24]